MIGQFILKTEYLYDKNPFIQELIRLNNLPIDWEYCKRLEKLGLVEVLNRCDLVYHYPHDIRIRRQALTRRHRGI